MSVCAVASKNHPRYKRAVDDTVDDRCTPDAEFWAFNKRFGFTVDAAASAANARLPRFWTRESDGLSQSWAGERVWCNPPYSHLRPWFEKAWLETKAPLVVMLIPGNRTEGPPWQDLIEPYRDRTGGVITVEFLPGRIRFKKPGEAVSSGRNRPPFGCCLLIWDHSKEGPRP